jgi:hypothetical protein
LNVRGDDDQLLSFPGLVWTDLAMVLGTVSSVRFSALRLLGSALRASFQTDPCDPVTM